MNNRVVIDGRELELIEMDLPDGGVILDAFVIFRVQTPDDQAPAIYYTQSEGMNDESQIGVQVIVLDRCREAVKNNWVD